MRRLILVMMWIAVSFTGTAQETAKTKQTISLAGVWHRDVKGWVFQFSEDGTFKCLNSEDSGKWKIVDNTKVQLDWLTGPTMLRLRTYKLLNENEFTGDNQGLGAESFKRLAIATKNTPSTEVDKTNTDESKGIREWTNLAGAKVKASFISKKNGVIWLKKEDGKGLTIKEESLCQDDKDFLMDKPDTGEPALVKKEKTAKYPPEAKEYNGHHYMLYSDTSKWGSAKFKCSTRGGHLVVINNAEENKFVYELIKEHRSVWIGLTKNMEAWRWVTIDGGEFTNWAPGEPNINSKDNRDRNNSNSYNAERRPSSYTSDSKRSTIASKMGVEVSVCMYGAWYDGHNYYYHDIRNGRWDDRLGDDSDVTGYVCEWDE